VIEYGDVPSSHNLQKRKKRRKKKTVIMQRDNELRRMLEGRRS
jgi:hypothetical protein